MSEMNNGANGARPAKGGGFLGGCLSGCFLAVLVLVGLPVLFGTIAVVKVGGAVKELCSDLEDDDGKIQRTKYEYVWRWGDGGENASKVVRIKLDGEITSEKDGGSLLFNDEDYEENDVLSKVKAATERDDVAGIWLDVDSPGGEVVLSDEIRHALERFKKGKKGRFVFARFGTLACSGGYYVSTAADYIMASPSTLTGSIGVIMGTYNAAGLAEKLGVKSVNIVSAENKAMLDPLEPVNEGHVAILQKLIDEEYERFLDLVANGRGIDKDELRKVADGRVLSAQQALDAKLIDSIGYEEDALRQVEKMAKAADPDSDGVRVYWMKKDGPIFRFRSASGLLGEAAASILGKQGCGVTSARSPAAPLESRRK